MYVNDFRVGQVSVDEPFADKRMEPRIDSGGRRSSVDSGTGETDASETPGSEANAGVTGFGLPAAAGGLVAALLAVRWRER